MKRRKSNSKRNAGKKNPNPLPPKSKIKKKYGQKFRNSWLKEAELKDWLMRSVSPRDKEKTLAKCRYCSTLMTPKISVLRKHAASESHVKNAAPFSNAREPQSTLDHAYFISSSEYRMLSIFKV